MSDLIKAQTTPPSLSMRSHFAIEYPPIQTAASSIFSFHNVSVVKAILTSYWSSIIFNSSTFGTRDLVFERRKVSKLLWAHFGL
jgi:hypothetical protein